MVSTISTILSAAGGSSLIPMHISNGNKYGFAGAKRVSDRERERTSKRQNAKCKGKEEKEEKTALTQSHKRNA